MGCPAAPPHQLQRASRKHWTKMRKSKQTHALVGHSSFSRQSWWSCSFPKWIAPSAGEGALRLLSTLTKNLQSKYRVIRIPLHHSSGRSLEWKAKRTIRYCQTCSVMHFRCDGSMASGLSVHYHFHARPASLPLHRRHLRKLAVRSVAFRVKDILSWVTYFHFRTVPI